MARILRIVALLLASAAALVAQPERYALFVEDYGDSARGFTHARLTTRAVSQDEQTFILPNTIGAQAQLTIVAANVPHDLSTIRNVMDQTSEWYERVSFGATWFEPNDIAGPYGIVIPSTCDYYSVATRLRARASQAGFDLTRYRRFLYLAANLPCPWWGIAQVGGTYAWVNVTHGLRLRVTGHELGHNFGLWHSRSLNLVTGAVREYGDHTDIMGGSSSGSFGPHGKVSLGWLNNGPMPPLIVTTAPGTYRITLYDAPFDGSPRALKVPVGDGRAHYVARRAKGVYVYRLDYGGGPLLLKGIPLDTSATLPLGMPYRLPENDLLLTVVALDASGATVTLR